MERFGKNQTHSGRTTENAGKQRCSSQTGEIEPGENLMKLSKPELRDLVQVVTGHGNFSKHRHRCGKSVLPTCKYCGEGEETAEHHLAHCKGFSTQRHNAFGKTKVERGNFPRLPVKSIVLFNKGTKRLQAF